MDQLYTLNRVLEVRGSLPIEARCFVDLEQAFNSVPWGILWGVPQNYGVSGPLIGAVWSLYDGFRAWSALPAVSQTCFR